MPFEQGKITFRICYLPEDLPEDALELFNNKAAGSLDAVSNEPRWGWVTGRHLLDTRIDEETAIVGGYLHLCLREAERKIPNSLLVAECKKMELLKQQEDKTDHISRKDRMNIKTQVMERMLPNMPVQISGTAFVIDPNEGLLYVAAASDKKLELFLGFFSQTVGFEPIPMIPWMVSLDLFKVDPAGIPSLKFTDKKIKLDNDSTLGQNFLTWLWFYQNECEGKLPESKLGRFSFILDGPLLFVAEGQGALETAIKKGLPTESAEAKAALKVGKKLKSAKLIMVRDGDGDEWSVTLDADSFVFRGLALPDGEAMERHAIFEERMNSLFVFQKIFFELFRLFINEFKDSKKVAKFEEKAQRWVLEKVEK